MSTERPTVFECEGDRLVGVLHEGRPNADTGAIIVVGGPQYRVGSHRQFVLMARRFSAAGVPVLRFDVRGMGDSEGSFRSFEELDTDIRAAIDAFMASVPTLSGVVLVGLCDAASANLMYAHSDSRVRGLILLNPWVRTAQGEAKAYLRHYYLQRLLQKTFWRKVLSGELAVTRSIREFMQSMNLARQSGKGEAGSQALAGQHFVERMLAGWKRFEHPVLIAISGRDLTAQEFMDLCRADGRWRSMVGGSRCLVTELPEADHTMSDEASLAAMSDRCVEWMRNLR